MVLLIYLVNRMLLLHIIWVLSLIPEAKIVIYIMVHICII